MPTADTRPNHLVQTLLALYWLALATVPTLAQLPAARLHTVFPAGGKAGSTVEVSVTGSDLDEAAQLRFSERTLSAQPKLKEGTDEPVPNTFIVTIPADLAPESCDVRVAGRFGVSNPRTFVIGDLPEMVSPTTNHSPAFSADVPVGTVINGRADTNAADYFRFFATKGRRILIECAAREIDSRMDDAMVLYDSAGKELERARRGGLLDFIAPVNGQFVVKLHDLTYRGGEDYFYRLTISTRPHIDFVLPPAGVAGSKETFVLFGRNLPAGTPAKERSAEGKPLEKLEVEIDLPADGSSWLTPAGIGLDFFEYRLPSAHGISNPALIGLATAPVVPEVEPNNSSEQAQRITPPCEYVGQFHPSGDRDSVTFEAKKGDIYWIEVFSHRLGLPTDPHVLIHRVTKNEKGQEQLAEVQELNDSDPNIGGPEFNTATRDPASRFEVKEDGTYCFQIRDLFTQTRDDPARVYRLAIRKESPDFQLVVLPQAPLPADPNARIAMALTPLLHRRETQPLKVLAFRWHGFSGEIRLSVEGLPAGVTSAPATIETGKNTALLPLTATDDVKSWAGSIRIIGRAMLGGVETIRQARGGTVMWHVPDLNNEPVLARVSREFELGVCGAEKAALSIESVEEKVFEVTVGEKLRIPIRVNRHAEFMDNLKLKAVGLSALDSLPELEVTTKTNVATLELDLAKHKLPPGAHTFCLRTQTSGSYRSYAAEAQVAEGDAARAEQEANTATAEAKKAAEALATSTKVLAEAEAQANAASGADKEGLAAKVPAAAEAKTAAEKASSEAAARAQAAEKKKAETKSRFNDLKTKSAGKTVNLTVYSTPITVEVKPEEKK